MESLRQRRWEAIVAQALVLGWEPLPGKPHTWALPGTRWRLRSTPQYSTIYQTLPSGAGAIHSKVYSPSRVAAVQARLQEVTARMTEQTQPGTPALHVLLRCAGCGTVLLSCQCPGIHEVREVACCGVCTATGADVEEEPHD